MNPTANTPIVSVIITTYNRCELLRQAIDSVLSQKCDFSFEIIVGDDCSSDNTRCVLDDYHKRYPQSIVLNFQEKNCGVGTNWATSCKLARGKYIAFLDDDDYWCDDCRLQRMVGFLEKNANYGLAYSNYWVLNEKFNKKYLANKCLPSNVDKVDYMLKVNFTVLFSTTIIRKEVFDRYITLDDYVTNKFQLQDWPTLIIMAKHCDFHYFEEPSVVYRLSNASISRPNTYQKVIDRFSIEKIEYEYVCAKIGLEYNEKAWDIHVNGILLSLAYLRNEYKYANLYGKAPNVKHIQTLCSKNIILFKSFVYAKRLKRCIFGLFG